MNQGTKVGCCGYPVSREKYYKHFNCIEINITFYQLPEIKTAKKWLDESPANFEFIVKAWQLITHLVGGPTYRRLKEKIPESRRKYYGFFQPTDEVFEAWDRTKRFMQTLGCTKVLFQCPASFKPTDGNIANMKKFFHTITKSSDYPVTRIWEPRGDWQEPQIKSLCKELNLIHCVDPTRAEPAYGRFNYFRLHGKYVGKKIDYNYKYTTKQLKGVLSRCDKKLNYVMFNNMTMFDDGLKFKQM